MTTRVNLSLNKKKIVLFLEISIAFHGDNCGFFSQDDFMKKIKNWQFNPPADEEDEWPTGPRFNPLLHSTMISDNHDNGSRPQCAKV